MESHHPSPLPQAAGLKWVWISSSVRMLEDAKEREVKGKEGASTVAVAKSS